MGSNGPANDLLRDYVVAGGSVILAMASMLLDEKTIVTVTFGGGLTSHASLVDGTYLLTIDGQRVRDRTTGARLDGDGDGQVGGIFTFGSRASDAFFRLYGDSDGDRDVDAMDFLRFRTTMGKISGHLGFLAYFDADFACR